MIEFLGKLDAFLWGTPLIVLMVVTGFYFTIRSGFFQFSKFGFIMKRTAGTIFKKNDSASNEKGMISAFEAIATAIGGTVGFGNIAGVATAVAAGGPGAIFWMWATALLGMILKQVEVTLGCYYREQSEKGDYYGGPTYYMEKGLGQDMHWGGLWKIPAILFGLGIFSTFFITSSNLTASQVVAGAFNFKGFTIGSLTLEGEIVIGILISIVCYIITGGGTKKIANLFTKMVPAMSALYIGMGILMILINIKNVPAAFGMIFSNAFTGTAAIGGFAGATVKSIVSTGMARAVYSNEAGWGTSPMIHSSAKTPHPVEQGLWGSFEVFFDTIIICTITALSVVLSGEWTSGATGGSLALNSFAHNFGLVGSILLAIVMIVFSVTTAGGWFTYYLAILEHLCRKESKFKEILMKVFYAFRAAPGLFWTIYLVKTNNQGFIWTLVDITSAIPTFINVAVILVLSGKYFALLKDYKARYMNKGELLDDKIFFENK